MRGANIRPATVADAGTIADMLARLADDLGDANLFSSTPASIAKHGFGKAPMFHVMLAETGGLVVGFALYFAHYSTYRGQSGVYVQDLWIDPETRGGGVGHDLLAAAATHAATTWGATYMKLSVHTDNPKAARFYERLEFTPSMNETPMTLENAAFQALPGVL